MINASSTIFAQMLEPHRIEFPNLGFGFTIDPTAFTIFGLDIQWYGIIITLGLILAIIYVFPRMKRFGIDSDRAVDAVIGGVLGGIVGARLYYVAMRWEDYKKDSIGETLKAVINTRGGGLAIYGGIIGAIIVGFVICKIRKVRILPMLDVTVLGLLIGQGIGRWGNFVNQEAFGKNTDLFIGMTGGTIQRTISNETQLGGSLFDSGMLWEKAVHPCFLYESLWCLLGFALLAFISKKRRYDGQILLMYMAWYGFERFFVEGLRTDSLMLGNIRVSQALSAIIFIVSVIIQIVMFFRIKRDPESFVLYASTEESRKLIEESRRKAMGIKGADAIMGGHDEIGDLSDDDEIGILPDDDDDEIGILPDEDDDDDFFAEAEKKLNGAKEAVKDKVEAVKDKVEDTAKSAKDKAEKTADTVKEKAEDAVEAVRDKVEDTAKSAKDKAEKAADTVKDKTEDTAKSAEKSAEKAADSVKDTAKEAVEAAADKAENAAEAVEDTAEKAADAAGDKYDQLAQEHDKRLSGGSGKGGHNKKKKHKKK